MWISKIIRNLSLVLGLTLFLSTGAMASLPQNSLQAEEDSLALQMARRMVLLHDTRPLPSLGYQLSARMIRQKQAMENNKKFQKASGRRASKKQPVPQAS